MTPPWESDSYVTVRSQQRVDFSRGGSDRSPVPHFRNSSNNFSLELLGEAIAEERFFYKG